MNQKTVDKFLARVSDEPTEKGCILWKGAIHNRKGYGYMRVDGKNVLAHRLAWEVTRGEPVPDGMLVCHKCDVTSCVTGSHLFLGTIADNNADCVKKGRHVKGSRVGGAKLNEASVAELRALHASGAATKDLAVRFGIALRTVQYTVAGKRTWRHVK